MFEDRWSNDYEIERGLTPCGGAAGGPVLHVRSGKKWLYTGEGSILISGVPGSGKTRSATLPMVKSLLDARESVLLIDVKGDIYRQLEGHIPADYHDAVYKLDFRSIRSSHRCDPLAYPCHLYRSGTEVERELAVEIVTDFARSVCRPPQHSDPFWYASAADLFIGAALFLMECAPREVSIESVFRLVTNGARQCIAGRNYLARLLSLFPDDQIFKTMLETYAYGASDTSAGVRQSFSTAFMPFVSNPGLCSIADNTFKIWELDPARPTAIFIILPDETTTYDALGVHLMSELCSFYLREAEVRFGGRLPTRLNMVCEESGNLPPLSCLNRVLNAGRSRNVRAALVVQSLSQLDAVYGRETARSILNAANVQLHFRTADADTAERLSRMCGNRTAPAVGGTVKEPLLTPWMAMAMQPRCGLCLCDGMRFMTRLPDFSELFPLEPDAAAITAEPPAEACATPEEHALRVFDIERFVKQACTNVLEDSSVVHAKEALAKASLSDLTGFEKLEQRETCRVYKLLILDYDGPTQPVARLLVDELHIDATTVLYAIADGCPLAIHMTDRRRLAALAAKLKALGCTACMAK